MVLAGWWAPLEEGHRGSRCWGPCRPEGGQGGWGEHHCGPPRGRPGWCVRRVVGSAAVVTACRPCSGLVAGGICPPRELGVGICLETPPGWQTLMSVSQPCRRQGHGTSGTGPQPLHLCPAEDSGETGSFWEGKASSLELRRPVAGGLPGAGASDRRSLESTAANGP